MKFLFTTKKSQAPKKRNQPKNSWLKFRWSFLTLLLLPFCLEAQVTPTEGTVECLLVGDGAVFTDFGGLGGDNTVEGAPGNYLNCDCVTTTTICTVDDSPVTAEITDFGIFSTFDWLIILDSDNPANDEFPLSILDDPSNVTFQLFNNADGIGDGGSEAYGPGPEANQGTFPELTNTTFTATNATGCLTFVFRASGVVDDLGWDISISSSAGHPGDNLPCGTNVDCFPPGNIQITDITGSTATVTWDASADATSYILEYGPAGFVPGTGTVIMTSDLTASIDGLLQVEDYSIYIQSDCGADGTSFNAGPIGFTTTLDCELPTDVLLENITANSVDVSWTASVGNVSYLVEYGPIGFVPGTGTILMTSDEFITITDLDEITQYDVYVFADCDDDGISPGVGPNTFITNFTNPPQSCSYTLNLFDSFGDGWNGSILTVTHFGTSTDYTIGAGGDFATFEFDVFEGLPIELTYTAGAFQNEVTYEMLDPDGLVAFQDGPNPATGLVYNELAFCPNCPILDDGFINFTDITFDGATMNWVTNDSATAYTLEWGLTGFTYGFGNVENTANTSFDFTGLMENTLYDVYILANCPDEDSQVLGPFTFQTGFINPPKMCNYILELNDVGFGNDGWQGSFVAITINGITTEYTLNGVDDDGVNAQFTVPVLSGFDLVVGFTEVGFGGFNYSYTLSDSDGLLLYDSELDPEVGDNVFETTAFCPDCPAASPLIEFVVDSLGDNAAKLSWVDVNEAMVYFIEYGPTGFPLGVGLVDTVDVDSILLTGLNACVTYDAYVTVFCGVDSLSTTVGPLTFTTTYSIPSGAPGDTCIYSLDLFDSFGDGWNGADIAIDHNSEINTYTVPGGGEEANFDLPFISNLPVTLNYTPGTFENEVSYDLIDPDGNIIFTDGPFPTVGEVYNFVACPSCPGPIDGAMLDINADNATVAWTSSSGAFGNYILEWGTLGFTLGTGSTATIDADETSFEMNNLQENTWYDVYITLDCGTEVSKPFGPISFQTIWLNDVGIGIIANPTVESCNLSADEIVTVGLRNYGQNPQSLFEYNFAVNGVLAPVTPPSDGFFTGVVGNDSTILVDFELTWDFSVPGFYVIEAWTNLDTDSDSANDTLRIELVTALPLPLMEDFEEGVLPEGWTTDEFNPIYADGAHGNVTTVIGDNVFGGDPNFDVQTSRYGPISNGDSLSFDYRFADFFAGTVGTIIGAGDTLQVQISEDCAETWTTVFVIDETNHTPSPDMTTAFVDLSAYAEKGINLRFRHTHGTGDYWVDLDNINILGCPPNLALSPAISFPTVGIGNDGAIALNPLFGSAPYNYDWNTGDETSTISNLQAGEYMVTVTDNNGCQDVQVYVLDEVVGVNEDLVINKMTVSPNPTNGLAILDLQMTQAAEVDVQLFSLAGRLIEEIPAQRVQTLTQEFDLSNQASGMYFVRILIDGQAHYERLVLTK